MPYSFADLVGQTTATTGTGTITLSGSIDGLLPFAGLADGATTVIRILAADGSWEICDSVLGASGTTLTRGTLRASSTGSRIALPTGTHEVRIVPAAFLLNGLNASLINFGIGTLLTTASIASGSMADTGLSVTITPRFASSRILLASLVSGAGASWSHLQITDSANAAILQADAWGSRSRVLTAGFLASSGYGMWQRLCLASHVPGATTAQTYKLRWNCISGTAYLGRTLDATDNSNNVVTPGVMIALEVAA